MSTARGASLQFLLFGEGTADPNEWRPAKDDSMWWMRRDALVRCIGASAFAGADVHVMQRDSSLIQVRGTITQTTPVPTEAAVLGRIKDAIKGTGPQKHLAAGDVHFTRWAAPSNSSQQRTKREVVRLLQQSATPEFLKKWNLNVSEKLALKKCSGAHVEKAAAEWAASGDTGSASPVMPALRGLRPGSVVVLLHEDYPLQLPLFQLDSGQQRKIDIQRQIAVPSSVSCRYTELQRDMQTESDIDREWQSVSSRATVVQSGSYTSSVTAPHSDSNCDYSREGLQ